MIERTASRDAVVAWAMWAAVGGLMGLATVVMCFGQWKASLLLAEAACCLSAGAATRHIRYYAVRVSELVRRIDQDRREGGSPGQADPRLPLQSVRQRASH